MDKISALPEFMDHGKALYRGVKKKGKKLRGPFVRRRERVMQSEDCFDQVRNLKLVLLCSLLILNRFRK